MLASNFEQRNELNYNQQLNMIERSETIWSTYGIKYNSPLNSLRLVHITRLLPPDITHDIGEGIIPYELY